MSVTHTAVRRIQFCAGHRVMEHGSKCRHLHGHNYVAFIHATALEELDRLGMVVDFGVLKEVVGGWIDRYWDHGFIHHQDDTAARRALHEFELSEREVGIPEFRQKVFELPANPTAENMAEHLLHTSNDLLSTYYRVGGEERVPLRVTKVVLWETENCYAEASLETPA